ncbi:DUF934 domain-containing protein [Methylibium sp.]|uniref:DUF934 domain-containing protein n=1 Tax=Methylibium sp. TaxID=2067992 RepID=UPI003D13D474
MKFIDIHHDTWHTVGGEDGPIVTITPAAHRLLTLLQWHSVRSLWPADLPVGVVLPNDADVESLESDLPRLALIALHFPKWVDGRAYSQARLLRSRYRFKGEVRATGDVLVDMMPLLARTGFDAVALRADQSIEVAQRALGFFRGHYQGDARDNHPLFALTPDAIEALAKEPAREFVSQGAAI